MSLEEVFIRSDGVKAEHEKNIYRQEVRRLFQTAAPQSNAADLARCWGDGKG
jgi:hypothetical protein